MFELFNFLIEALESLVEEFESVYFEIVFLIEFVSVKVVEEVGHVFVIRALRIPDVEIEPQNEVKLGDRVGKGFDEVPSQPRHFIDHVVGSPKLSQ